MSAPSPIAVINDRFRQALGLGGKLVITVGIRALTPEAQSRVRCAVEAFDRFTEDNDPYGEHDFGAIDLDGLPRVFWKIDYYDRASFEAGEEIGSDNPADVAATLRVLTIMLAEEF